MTNPDLELIHRQFMLAIKAIHVGTDLSAYVPDPVDFGRKFQILKALAHAATAFTNLVMLTIWRRLIKPSPSSIWFVKAATRVQ